MRQPLSEGQLRLPGTRDARIVAAWPAVTEGSLGGRGKATREAYDRAQREWATWCAAHELGPLDARRADVQAWVDELVDAGARPRTVVRKLAGVRAAYNYAVETDVLVRSPAEHVRSPKVSKRSTAIGLTDHQLAALMRRARDAGPLELAIVQLLFVTGLRVSEACNADVDDYRTDRGVLLVTRKGSEDDDPTLAPGTTAALDAYLGDRRRGPLLVNPRTSIRLSRFAARRIVIALSDAAGLPRGVTAHTLRHGHGTRARELGIDLGAVQESLAHKDPSTTQLYDHAIEHRKGTATRAVDAWAQQQLDVDEPSDEGPDQEATDVRP